jgi:sugar-specific transcriptional regulator TrmB
MTSTTESNIIKILSRLDVPGNAAKIYLFLLKNGPSSGYKITKVSGVNSGVVYRELERLKSKNLVFQLGVNQKKHEAINGNGLIEILKRQNKSEESLLEKSLNELLKGSDTLISVKIAEYDDLIYEVQKEILSAKEEILIRVWSDEFVKIEEQLRKAEEKGINIQLLSFTPLSKSIGRTFSYNIDPNAFKENWKRGLALAVDNKKVIVGNKIGKNPIQGLITNDQLIAESIRDQILLDLELAKGRLKRKEGAPNLEI